MNRQLAVVILAAGKSTRFKSKTTKLLHELCGKPMIEWVLDAACALDPAQIIVVYGKHSKVLKERYEDGYCLHKLDFVEQEPPLGTGHALLCAEPLIDDGIDDVLVLPGDTPLLTAQPLRRLIEAVAYENKITHAVLTAKAGDPAGYGRVLLGDEGIVKKIVEHVEATEDELAVDEINSGMYLFDRAVFEHVRKSGEVHGASAVKGEYFLPHVAEIARTVAVHTDDFAEISGVNDRYQLAWAEGILQDRLRRHWMQEGVTFQLPETTYLHENVRLSPDVTVGPHCVLTRGTSVGEGTVLVQGCLLEGCEVGANCELRHVRGTFAVMGNCVQAGPYVNLRPGTELADNVKVGNFVETKNAAVGEGSKLPHLQYVGDATLGPRCNIGAGTIFCNYDGFSKNHTTLGAGVFIGSNSALQGGITIGDGAYVAMGSSITKDIPAGALGVGRARQENKPDYVEKLKQRLKRRKQENDNDNSEANQAGSGGAK